MSKRAALYLRVSTSDQTTENQRRELQKLCELRGWEIVAEYEDAGISGAKGRKQRPALDRMLKDATKRKFDIMVAWSVDRLGRSTSQVTTAMDELADVGVDLYFFKESMDTSTPHGKAMLEMAAVFAKLEREMIVARVKSGIDRAKAKAEKEGKPHKHGRPTIDSKKEQAIIELRKQGMGMLKIAKEVGVGSSTVQRVIKEMVAT
ncbi:recombinase family protein [Terasakiella pusilla]|uniref:recombinase family protein n=1 Tax=Terasakiella pusilla TaxID=64973 RepID=UPI003AA95906